MGTHVVVAGSNGDLGKRIVKALVGDGAIVTALVRSGSSEDKIKAMAEIGARPVVIDLSDAGQIAAACEGAECVVSAFAGLRDVIVDRQTVVLKAALQAGVGRFIPSDFATGWLDLPRGENRNYDLRREFHDTLDGSPIQAASIFCGCFAEVLARNIPVLDSKKKTVGYWESPDHKVYFSTMDDTAAFTAQAALDPSSPAVLHCASFAASANDFVEFTAQVTGKAYELVKMGTLEDFRKQNKANREAHPEGEQQLYARLQQGQYLQSMFSAKLPTFDNGRYPELSWTPMTEAIHLHP